MESTKVFQVISSLNKFELKRLDKFLQSPFFNESELLHKLFLLLQNKKFVSDDSSVRKNIWKQLLKNKTYSDVKFRRLCSDLLKLIEKFLAYYDLQHEPTLLHAFQLKAIEERDLTKQIPVSLQLAKHRHGKLKAEDEFYYFNSFLLEVRQNRLAEKLNKRVDEKNLSETLNELDNFYLLTKLKYCSAILHYGKLLNTETKISMFDETVLYLKNNISTQTPAVQIYYHLIQTYLDEQNTENFYAVKTGLLHPEQLPTSTVQEIFFYALNYCVRKINFGEMKFLNEIFSLYELGLKQKLLFDKNILSEFDYKNIITVALRLKKFTWAEKFIHQYQFKLKPTDRKNAFTFSLAKLYFYKKDFDNVLPLLQDVEFSDVFYNLDSKALLLKTFYEMDERESMDSLIHSFRNLLSRKKLISQQHRTNYLNLIKYVKKLSRLDYRDKKKISSLKNEINSAKSVADKNWILEKLEEMK